MVFEMELGVVILVGVFEMELEQVVTEGGEFGTVLVEGMEEEELGRGIRVELKEIQEMVMETVMIQNFLNQTQIPVTPRELL